LFIADVAVVAILVRVVIAVVAVLVTVVILKPLCLSSSAGLWAELT